MIGRIILGLSLCLAGLACKTVTQNEQRKPNSDFSTLEEIRAHFRVPGMGLALVHPEKASPPLTIEVSGIRKMGKTAALQATDPFHLGSCTKSMTATLISIAIAEGKFTYETPLVELFPKQEVHLGYRGKTLRDLLVHRSGVGTDTHALNEAFPDQTELARILADETRSREARTWITEGILRQGPRGQADYEYSNPAYLVLGHLLEVTYGKNWEELMKKKIFAPLGMRSCGFGPVSIPAETAEPSRPWGHLFQGDVYLPRHLDNSRAYGPAGTVHCTLADWAKYARYHLDGIRKKRPLPPEIHHALYENPSPDGDTAGGWLRLVRDSGPRYYFRGSNTLNYAEIILIPSIDSAVLSGTNAGGVPASDANYEAIVLGVKRLGAY